MNVSQSLIPLLQRRLAVQYKVQMQDNQRKAMYAANGVGPMPAQAGGQPIPNGPQQGQNPVQHQMIQQQMLQQAQAHAQQQAHQATQQAQHAQAQHQAAQAQVNQQGQQRAVSQKRSVLLPLTGCLVLT